MQSDITYIVKLSAEAPELDIRATISSICFVTDT